MFVILKYILERMLQKTYAFFAWNTNFAGFLERKGVNPCSKLYRDYEYFLEWLISSAHERGNPDDRG